MASEIQLNAWFSEFETLGEERVQNMLAAGQLHFSHHFGLSASGVITPRGKAATEWLARKAAGREEQRSEEALEATKQANLINAKAIAIARDSRSIALGALVLAAIAFAKSMGWL